MHTGAHLLIDAYVADATVLTSEYLLHTCSELLTVLDLQQLGESVVREISAEQLFVLVPFVSGHLAIHAWPESLAIMVEVFSCGAFDTDSAYQLFAHRLRFSYGNRKVVSHTDPKPVLSAPPSTYFPWQRT